MRLTVRKNITEKAATVYYQSLFLRISHQTLRASHVMSFREWYHIEKQLGLFGRIWKVFGPSNWENGRVYSTGTGQLTKRV